MITPPGGTVLDPFAGSGTTGAAAQAEGFRATLIEREAEYVADLQIGSRRRALRTCSDERHPADTSGGTPRNDLPAWRLLRPGRGDGRRDSTASPKLTEAERQVWILDQTINDRGVKLDRAAIEHAIAVRDYARLVLDAEMARITGGIVKKCSQTKALMDWIRSLGVQCDSIAKDKQAALMDDADEILGDLDVASDAPNVVRQAIMVPRRRRPHLDCQVSGDAAYDVLG